jgi:hypothetical protein
MAKKEAIVKETAAVARKAPAAKPKTTTPRVRTVKHSKTVAAEPAIAHMDGVHVDTPQTNTDHHAAISRLAYSYWDSRGCQGGTQLEDWLRAEQEYGLRSAQL